jgi:homoserine O-succinyltransferase/O-acetyltransferase
LPEHYFDRRAQAILAEYADRLIAARERDDPLPEMPESLLLPHLDNTWHDSAEAIVNNWVGKVYQVTNADRRLPFMEGVDPSDPLGLKG